MSQRERIIKHLKALVAFDTCNPPREIDGGGIFAYLRGALPGFEHQLIDSGEGHVMLLSQRGKSDLLFNFHIDTVPVNESWQRPPHQLQVDAARAYGLGACDIKGASAAMLAAAQQTEGPLALLFSSDEESGDSRCIRDFLAAAPAFTGAVVAEPTSAKAIFAHRGIASVEVIFNGIPGHSSASRALSDSATHRAVDWLGKVLEFARSRSDQAFQNLSGLRLNVGTIDGGVKPNMIAGRCMVRFGFRTLPGQAPDQLLETLRSWIPEEQLAQWQVRFIGPALPANDQQETLLAPQKLAADLGLQAGPAVDFWTEAALFSEAGIPAIVFGPGHIEQAHSADEWVEFSQLEEVAAHYQRIIDNE